MTRVAQLKAIRGETVQAFVEVKSHLLGQVLEFGQEDLQMLTMVLFARTCVQMAALRDLFELDNEELTSTFEELQKQGGEA